MPWKLYALVVLAFVCCQRRGQLVFIPFSVSIVHRAQPYMRSALGKVTDVALRHSLERRMRGWRYGRMMLFQEIIAARQSAEKHPVGNCQCPSSSRTTDYHYI